MSSGKELTKSKLTRIAIVSSDRCKPTKCRQECRRNCPVNAMGKRCVDVTPEDKLAYLSETFCNGCGICVKKCPFDAISIINLPTNLEKETTHRYGANSFKLHRLPIPRRGQVLGLVGTNGIGKSTALKVLSGKLKPNFGRFHDPPEWAEIVAHYRGSSLQNYFKKIVEGKLTAVIKPQYVDQIAKIRGVAESSVGDLLKQKDERGMFHELCSQLELNHVLDRTVSQLSGGELQRFACAMLCVQDKQLYMFDEPSSYLDIKQRLNTAKTIRNLLHDENFVIVVEHDLAVLDYLSDFICSLYGVAGAYGVVTLPSGVREGINIFLDGYIPSENLRFRDTALVFDISDGATAIPSVDGNARGSGSRSHMSTYPAMSKTLGNFHLEVDSGEFNTSQIIVMLGENGTGKTTFIKLLASRLTPDGEVQVPALNVSYKPQKISPKSEKTVHQLLLNKITTALQDPQFHSDVIKPLQIDKLFDREVQNLSGGELQRVALTLCLGTPADLYLIDEPSAYLDVEQRLNASKVIKRFVLHAKKTAFVVEHDFIMASYLADTVLVFEGTPGERSRANGPQTLLAGMNRFLAGLGVTFRRDKSNLRPRINKIGGAMDREQKKNGEYFFVED